MSREGLLDNYRGEIVDVVLKQAMEALVKRASWLSIGPINWLASLVLSKIITVLLDKTILGVNLYLIQISNDGDVEEFNSLLERIEKAPEGKKRELQDELKKSARSLIKLLDNTRM